MDWYSLLQYLLLYIIALLSHQPFSVYYYIFSHAFLGAFHQGHFLMWIIHQQKGGRTGRFGVAYGYPTFFSIRFPLSHTQNVVRVQVWCKSQVFPW